MLTIFGIVLVVVGLGIVAFAVRAWFSGAVYLPAANQTAIPVGLVLAAADVLVVVVL